jgi:ABC-type sugar transport system permease subunit
MMGLDAGHGGPLGVAARSDLLPERARGRSELRRQIWRNRWAYVFISPFFILFAVFGLFPPLFGLYLSFQKWDIISPMQYVGLRNYSFLLKDALFWKSLANNVILILMATLPELPLALVIAYLLDSYVRRLRNTLLAAYFSPMVTSAVAVTMVFAMLYGERYGLFNSALRSLGLPSVMWLTRAVPIKFALTILLLWRWLGWNVVLYLAGLQGINHEYYEAARVDGASGARIFVSITVPLMRSMILYTTVISIIGMLQLFTEPYMLAPFGAGGSMGGPRNSILTMVMYLYQNGFGYFRFGYASAIAYAIFVITLVLSLLNIKLIGRPAD